MCDSLLYVWVLTTLNEDCYSLVAIVTYENAVVSEEVAEDAEVSAIFRDHPPLIQTRSDASTSSTSHMVMMKPGKYV